MRAHSTAGLAFRVIANVPSIWNRSSRQLSTGSRVLLQAAQTKTAAGNPRFGTVDAEMIAAPPPTRAQFTSLTNPAEHAWDHEGFFYEVPQEDVDKYFGYRTLQLDFKKQVESFRSCDLMIRSPGLEVIDYVKKSDLTAPAIRYVLYGRHGTGKSLTITYLTHFFAKNGWLVFHVPKTRAWSRKHKEIQESTFKPGRIDLPLESVEWLQHFLRQSSGILKESKNLLTHKQYTWSKREQTPPESPLLEIVELGIKRPRYSDDCIGVLVEELKFLASEGNVKVAVLIDEVNAMFNPTSIPRADNTTVPPEAISAFCHFKKTLKNDWSHGAVVTSVDGKNILDEPTAYDDSLKYYPRYLLRKAGWALMDPFVPVLVSDYKDKELANCIDYYLEKRWLQHEAAWTDQGRDELRFVSGNNPGALYDFALRL